MKRAVKQSLSLFLILTLLGNLLLMPAMAQEPELAEAVPEAYESFFPVPAGDENELLDSGDRLGTVLEGRSIMFLGDSLMAGYGLDDYRQSWCSMLGSAYGMVTTNNAISASTIGVSSTYGYQPGGCYEPYCQRALPAGDFDVILVAGCGNDWYCEIPLGSDLGSRNTGTLIGAMNVLIDRLQTAYPDALVLFVTSWNSTGAKNGLGYTTADYNNTFIKVCQNRGIPCFRACDTSVSGIDASSSAFRKQYFLTETDYWHLNARGQKLYLPVIAGWLQEMLLEHYVVSGFYDVTVHDWYADAVAYAVGRGITNGTSDVTFAPNMVMQRGMLLTMLYRAAGTPDISGLENPFADLDTNSYYYDAVIWGYHAGVAMGVGDGLFKPEAELTREQLATFLYRYVDGANSGFAPGNLGAFTDSGEIGSFALEAMSWAVGSDILHGGGDGTLAPKRAATRAEMVQLLANYFRTLE